MTDMIALRAAAATARAAGMAGKSTALPCGDAKREDVKFHSEFRAKLVEREGQEFYEVEGYASTTEQPYEMWDMFGPYDEVVSRDAFDKTLAAEPMVVFRFNHGGTAMATTANGRLELSVDALGLRNRAWINPKRADVRDLITAIEDKDVTEESFMFMITNGEWNEDFTQFRIREADLDRGDVGPVTYGANPNTRIAARAGEFLSIIPDVPILVAREAMARLRQRPDLATPADVAARLNKQPDAADVPADVPAAVAAGAAAGVADAATAADAAAAATLARGVASNLALTADLEAMAASLRELKVEAPKIPDPPKAPVGSSIRLRLAQLEIDQQHAQE